MFQHNYREASKNKTQIDSWQLKNLTKASQTQVQNSTGSSLFNLSFSWNWYIENSIALSIVGTPSLKRHDLPYPLYRATPTNQAWFHQNWTYKTNESTMFTKYKWGVTNRSMGDPKKLYQPEYLTQYRWRLPHSWVDGAPPLLSLPCLYTRTHPKNTGSQENYGRFTYKWPGSKRGAPETSGGGAIPLLSLLLWGNPILESLTNSSSFGEDDSLLRGQRSTTWPSQQL